MTTDRISAGILLFRRVDGDLEVLLAHPGGPRFATRDEGYWSIPKGEVEPGEALEAVARREFEEETGHDLGAAGLIPLGDTVQKGGKLVHCWAAEGDFDPGGATSNTYLTEWPAGSGQLIEVPEIDRVAWFEPATARLAVKAPQVVFIDRLVALLAGEPGSRGGSAIRASAPAPRERPVDGERNTLDARDDGSRSDDGAQDEDEVAVGQPPLRLVDEHPVGDLRHVEA